MALLHGFDPIINKRSKVLILGSFPGPRSLELKEYYGHKGNDFWRIIGKVLGVDLHNMSYEKKKSILLRNRIGLWDVFAQAQREGALDSAIKSMVYNDFKSLFKEYKNIQVILIEGIVPYDAFMKLGVHEKFPHLKIYRIHSTSGASRRITSDAKATIIKKILDDNDIRLDN